MFFTLSPSATEPRLTKESFNRFSLLFFFSSRSRHTSCGRDWSSDVCSSDLFPPESYTITYPAPGEPQLAEQVLAAITAAGIQAQGDAKRGFDHGLFVPLKLMYPDADIPCIQIGRASCRERV